jgi:hypothetical protein
LPGQRRGDSHCLPSVIDQRYFIVAQQRCHEVKDYGDNICGGEICGHRTQQADRSTNVNRNSADIVLVGAGIMSATLAVLLKELAPISI